MCPSLSVSVSVSPSPGQPHGPRLDGTTGAVNVTRGSRVSQKTQRRREGGRQADRSNGYGPRLQMLETPDISLLVGAGYFVAMSRRCKRDVTVKRGGYGCNVAVGAALVR